MLGAWWRRQEAARVSVVIPLYNHAAYIAEAVDSVIAQGSIVKELVVLDDGSTDASADVMAQLRRRDQRIRFERQANQGAHATINTALGSCTGEFLAILNSDDAYLPGRLTALAAALEADASADIAVSGLQFMDGSGAAIENAWQAEAQRYYQAGADLGVALLNGNFVMTTSNLLFRRAAWDTVGPFAALRYAHDLDWLLRAVALGRRIVLVDKPLLRYRSHGSNTISEDHTAVRAEWAMVAAAYLTVLWDRPDSPPIVWDHAAAAHTVFRQHQLDRAVPSCMAYLRRHASLALDRSPMLHDAAFKSLVKGWV